MSRPAARAALSAAISLSALLASAPAFAQVEPGSTQVPEATPVAPSEDPRVTDTPADRFGFFEGEELQVETGTEDNKFTLRVALPVSPSLANRFSLRVETPISGDGDAMPASLDALANGTRATLSWGYFPRRINRDTTATKDIVSAARDICKKEESNSQQCELSHYAVYRHARENWLKYLRLRGLGVTDFGLDATVGINDFEWLDRTTLVPQKARHTDWSVAGHVAHFFPGRQLVLTGSVSYQRAYEAAEEEQLCPPGSTDPADCVTARGNAPTLNKNFLLSAGMRYRRVNPDGSLGQLAIAPILTYDVVDDVWGVDVPVYLIPGKDGALTGGVRFGYRSDRKEGFSVAAFFGTTFNFFQR